MSLFLVSQTHTASGFCTQVNPDTQKVSRTGSFATLATYTVFSSRRGGYLSSFAAIPGNHFQNVSRASADALSAANAGIVDFDRMRHLIKTPNECSSLLRPQDQGLVYRRALVPFCKRLQNFKLCNRISSLHLPNSHSWPVESQGCVTVDFLARDF